MRTVPIPGGEATFRDPKELRARDRMLVEAARMAAVTVVAKFPDPPPGNPEPGHPDSWTPEVTAAYEEAQGKVPLSVEESMLLLQIRWAIIVALLASWSLPKPLPTWTTIGDLDGEMIEALQEATAAITATSMAETDFGIDPDKESPPMPSSASSGLLEGEAESPSTSLATSGTESTGTEVSTGA